MINKDCSDTNPSGNTATGYVEVLVPNYATKLSHPGRYEPALVSVFSIVLKPLGLSR